MAAISDLLQDCLSQLTSLINSDVLSDHTEVPLQEWTDELGRLRVWAANIGAHQTRQSSLDYRLRDASHIKSQIARLLNHIQELLTDLEDVLDEDSDEESRDDKPEDTGDMLGNGSTTEIQEIHKSLVETITQLYQMSMIIRNPAQHDRLVGTNKLDSEPFQFWAKQHMSTKYPNADALAIDRISSAMARQRAILKYRERHHAKLSHGIDPEDDGKSAMLSETVATDVFREIPGRFSDMISEAGASETSYGGTLLEGTGEDAPKIPPIPKKGAEQRPFECPYCFYIIAVGDKRAWTRHIFHDLMPYVCIFPGCSTPNKLYEGRRQWYRHIQQAHTSKFSGNGTYGCSICGQDSLPNTTFQRHVGQHLEELALFLLPRNDSEEDENTVPDEEVDSESSRNDLSDTSREENYPVEGWSRQREDVKNAAISAPSPGIHDGLERIKEAVRELEQAKKAAEGELEQMNKKNEELQRRLLEEFGRTEEMDDVINKRKEKLEREQMERDKEFERLRLEFGYTEADVEKILGEKKKDKLEAHKKHPNTWMKVHRKYLLPETLQVFNLPWEWDEDDNRYIIIKQWVAADLQEQLFDHTQRLREERMVSHTPRSLLELTTKESTF